MKRLFVETAAFSKVVKNGKITDTMLQELQKDILAEKGVILRNTGGLAKIRLATEKGGKSGGWRVVYADYPPWEVTVLVLAFPKNVHENITQEQAKQLKRFKEQMDKEMERTYGKTKRQKGRV